MEKLEVDGTVELLEVYRNEKDKTYSARLDITVHSEKSIYSELKIDVRISEKQYSRLRKEISKSVAERPILRLKGDLELIIGSVCFN